MRPARHDLGFLTYHTPESMQSARRRMLRSDAIYRGSALRENVWQSSFFMSQKDIISSRYRTRHTMGQIRHRKSVTGALPVCGPCARAVPCVCRRRRARNESADVTFAKTAAFFYQAGIDQGYSCTICCENSAIFGLSIPCFNMTGMIEYN